MLPPAKPGGFLAEFPVTEAELLQALADARPAPHGSDEGSTVAELAARLYGHDSSHTRKKMTKSLLILHAEGRLVIGRRQVARLSGGTYPAPVYRVTDKIPRTRAKR